MVLAVEERSFPALFHPLRKPIKMYLPWQFFKKEADELLRHGSSSLLHHRVQLA